MRCLPTASTLPLENRDLGTSRWQLPRQWMDNTPVARLSRRGVVVTVSAVIRDKGSGSDTDSWRVHVVVTYRAAAEEIQGQSSLVQDWRSTSQTENFPTRVCSRVGVQPRKRRDTSRPRGLPVWRHLVCVWVSVMRNETAR